MTNNIQIFNNENFGAVRVIEENGEPMFCASDVCRALGYNNGRDAVAKHVEEGDVAKRDIIDRFNRTQQATFVNESGLYALIFGSKLPQAKQFKKWVTSEVLPAIRKSGGYMVARADDTDEDILARALVVAQATLKRREERIAALQNENAQQAAQIEADAPKVVFANAIVGSKTSCLIGELAKILSQNGYTIGQNRLFEWLRANGYLLTKGEYRNTPSQKAMEQGLFELKKGTRSGNDGVMRTTLTTKVTQKGCQYFINKLLGGNTQQSLYV